MLHARLREFGAVELSVSEISYVRTVNEKKVKAITVMYHKDEG